MEVPICSLEEDQFLIGETKGTRLDEAGGLCPVSAPGGELRIGQAVLSIGKTESDRRLELSQTVAVANPPERKSQTKVREGKPRVQLHRLAKFGDRFLV